MGKWGLIVGVESPAIRPSLQNPGRVWWYRLRGPEYPSVWRLNCLSGWTGERGSPAIPCGGNQGDGLVLGMSFQPVGQQTRCYSSLTMQRGKEIWARHCHLLLGFLLVPACPQQPSGDCSGPLHPQVVWALRWGCHRVCILLSPCNLACGLAFYENRANNVGSLPWGPGEPGAMPAP